MLHSQLFRNRFAIMLWLGMICLFAMLAIMALATVSVSVDPAVAHAERGLYFHPARIPAQINMCISLLALLMTGSVRGKIMPILGLLAVPIMTGITGIAMVRAAIHQPATLGRPALFLISVLLLGSLAAWAYALLWRRAIGTKTN